MTAPNFYTWETTDGRAVGLHKAKDGIRLVHRNLHGFWNDIKAATPGEIAQIQLYGTPVAPARVSAKRDAALGVLWPER